MLRDPIVGAIPGKVELNEKGVIEVSPPSTPHGLLQAFLAGELRRLRPDGKAFTEVGIETAIGVRAPDVAWAAADFLRRHGLVSPLPNAPELCVEVVSPSNTAAELSEKVAAYIAAGAIEVWLAREDGTLEIYAASGVLRESAIVRGLTLPLAP
jgi:Uma2 family endonuclease